MSFARVRAEYLVRCQGFPGPDDANWAGACLRPLSSVQRRAQRETSSRAPGIRRHDVRLQGKPGGLRHHEAPPYPGRPAARRAVRAQADERGHGQAIPECGERVVDLRVDPRPRIPCRPRPVPGRAPPVRARCGVRTRGGGWRFRPRPRTSPPSETGPRRDRRAGRRSSRPLPIRGSRRPDATQAPAPRPRPAGRPGRWHTPARRPPRGRFPSPRRLRRAGLRPRPSIRRRRSPRPLPGPRPREGCGHDRSPPATTTRRPAPNSSAR